MHKFKRNTNNRFSTYLFSSSIFVLLSVMTPPIHRIAYVHTTCLHNPGIGANIFNGRDLIGMPGLSPHPGQPWNRLHRTPPGFPGGPPPPGWGAKQDPDRPSADSFHFEFDREQRAKEEERNREREREQRERERDREREREQREREREKERDYRERSER